MSLDTYPVVSGAEYELIMSLARRGMECLRRTSRLRASDERIVDLKCTYTQDNSYVVSWIAKTNYGQLVGRVGDVPVFPLSRDYPLKQPVFYHKPHALQPVWEHAEQHTYYGYENPKE